MPQFVLPILPKLTVTSIVDVLAVTILIYQLVLIMRGRRAAQILTGLISVAALYLFAVIARLDLLRTVLAGLAPYAGFALIVLFQSEIRWLLARIGRVRWLGLGGQLGRREIVEELLLAIEQMSDAKVGALIVVEGDIGLRTFIESGVPLDAVVSRDLICTIFQPGSALHDGAAILQGERVAAAACFLPLTTNPVMSRSMATRHRAGIGITEETDALVIVVSEESGRVALATGGEIEADVPLERVEAALMQSLSGRGRRKLERADPNLRGVERRV